MISAELIQAAITEAGLTREEAAMLMRVTRNTLYRWFQGKPVRNLVSFEYAVHIARRLIKAVELNLLPLPGGRTDKLAEVKKIIATIK
jgi:transcriptional regulator with XRE-family HTH domain